MRVPLRILAVTLATAGALAPLTLAARRKPASTPQHMIRVVGTLDGWRLNVDGTLYFRIKADHQVDEGGNEESIPPEGMWFYTPPDRSDDLQFEQMSLMVALASELQQERSVLTVTAKQERALDGSEPEEALPLESIGRP